VAIATLYALGGQPVVPWDVYIGNDETGQPKRFFGSVQEYGDLYRFVQSHAELFDQMESVAVVGIPVPVDKFNSQSTTALVRRLAQLQVPFAFVLTGGKEQHFQIDPNRARNFKLFTLANPETDFLSEDLNVLRSLSVERRDTTQITDAELRELSPFLAVGEASALKLYPRASGADDEGHLQIHLVDEARGEAASSDLTCRRRVGVKKSLIGGRKIVAAAWQSTQSAIKLDWTDGARELYVTVPECTLWGVLTLEFQR
jgi:hypothetical protein